ncbi:asparagine synthase (glutamine-hydrolyzing) [Spongiimicrobium sp. 3-5]|uniref:asparagine synthase (glutamine-hydrolyzing) n=1 Tax=Spongiimicrobium sp. 3-5 TaxID=3332596 RepID=UPI00397F4FE8
MCGIYGTTIRYEEHQIEAKLKRTSFRGPDKLDWKTIPNPNGQVTLGHNRLAIIDLDPRSNQPFNYEDQVEVVFNGEIYNFKEVRKTLEADGYTFRTSSDTEVLCAAYLKYGEACVEHLNGMFAFVIYDQKKQQLFGARDRLGQKPFHYYHDGRNFEFSSQLSSIQLFNNNLSISRKSIVEYLKWGNVPDPFSIFNEVKKLRAGYYFTYDLNTGQFEDHQYWDIDYKNKPSYTGSYNEALEELEDILKDAVHTRMFADVPVGVFLSGGIDSSLMSAIASKTTPTQIKTFSVKFNEKGFDESAYAQQVADHLQTDHHVIECNYDEGLELIDSFSYYYDEPFADPSAIPTLLLAKYTRKKVTVALSGDAGDEIFIGYHRYNWMRKVLGMYAMPKGLRKFSASLVGLAPHYRLKTIAKGLNYDRLEHLYLAILTGVDLSWIEDEWDYDNLPDKEYLFHNNKNLFERISDFDSKAYLNWDINTKVDRATMAFSLESRSPLMDHRVIELANKLPTEFKFQPGNQKRILKDLLYKHVPEKIFQRPKAGFTMPFREWFRKELKEFVLTELDREGLTTIPGINVDKTLKMINQHMDGSWNHYPLIWKLLVLKQWLNKNGKGLIIK